MKLSEAIRKGSEGRGQIRNAFYMRSTGDVCATTAAFVGVAGKLPDHPETVAWQISEFFPELAKWYDDETDGAVCEFSPLAQEIFELNDEEEWSFEKIAQWLEEKGL